ncbi:MAG: TldD/PmbA family protein [Acidobacteria bacterium]|nr:TldD/PmbA family protein [Acidobacteriota bacterium]
MITREHAARVLRTLLSRGGDFAEIYLQCTQSTRVSYDDGRLDEATTGEDAGVALRLVRGDLTNFSNFNRLDPAAILEEAEALARAAGGRKRRVSLPRLVTVRTTDPCPVKIHPRQVSLERKVEMVRRCDTAARGLDKRVVQATCHYRDTEIKVRVATSEGRFASDTRISTGLVCMAVARQDGQTRTGYHPAAEARGFELLRRQTPEKIGREAARIAVLQLEAEPAPAGSFTVVLSSSAGGTMVHEACGHGLEGDFILKELSVYARKEGQKVASDLITVVDDGSIPNMRGSSRIDDEGTPSTRALLIENVILRGYLHSWKTARDLGHEPTGHGRRESYRHLPIPRMRNTLILPGKSDPEEILRSVEEGIFVAQMGGGEVDIATGNFVFSCTEAYRIRGGRKAEPIRDATLIGNGIEVLCSIDRVGRDLGYGVGTCGKDGQGVPVADAQPTLRIPRITIGGTVAQK